MLRKRKRTRRSAKDAVARVSRIASTQLLLDADRGAEILSQALRSSWWEWNSGSSLFFWRWNGEVQQKDARDGMEIYVSGNLPSSQAKPARCASLPHLKLMASKVESMLKRGYLEEGFVRSNVHYFSVPKGEDDIRVVFDGTSSGLNNSLWAPNFYLPSSQSALLLLTFSSWMADVDFGEMFHNFFVAPKIRKYSGIDITPLVLHVKHPLKRDKRGSCVVRWTRLFMGMRPSPFNSVRYYYLGEEFVRGDPSLSSNPMRYDSVRLNLPCMPDYNPELPKVMKWNKEALDGKGGVAGDVITFVDDGRLTGYSKENCREVHRRFASRVQFLGMQDAPRKFRPPSQDKAGAWTGTIFRIGQESITKSVSQEKWDKAREIVKSLLKECEAANDGRPMLNRKDLERSTGFMNHLAMTFEDVIPFLKGLYLTLNSWRPGRDQDDWKMSAKKWKIFLGSQRDVDSKGDQGEDASLGMGDDPEAPISVRGSTRLTSDVGALWEIMSPDIVPRVSIRARSIVSVVYGFGDASGTGLGATFTCEGGFNYRIGIWGCLEKDESSNWKESANVVDALTDEAELGNPKDTEVFMFTDNSTVEACAAKGTSTSPKLLSLVIRLRSMTTRFGIKLHIFHVAGTRMIAQGTDGVSRGYLASGVMAGESMTGFVPIHISAMDRHPGLLPWILSWSASDGILLDPMGWFSQGHDIEGWLLHNDGFERPVIRDGRTYVWSPPPFAADVALAELRKARIKRQSSTHVFVAPRLCTTLWLKQLHKASDIAFEILPGSRGWPKEMHEPLLIGIAFPFLRFAPWQMRGTPKMFAMVRDLHALFKAPDVDPCDLLRKFWDQCLRFTRMPEPVVRKLLYLGPSS